MKTTLLKLSRELQKAKHNHQTWNPTRTLETTPTLNWFLFLSTGDFSKSLSLHD